MLFVFDLKKHLRLAKLRLLHFSQHYIIEKFPFPLRVPYQKNS